MKKLIVILLTFLSINSFSQTYMQKIISSSKLNDTIVGAYLANPATNGMVGFGLRSEDDTVYYYVQGDSLVLEFDDGTVYIIYDKTDTTVIYSGQVLEFDVDMAKFDTIQADNYIGISSVTIGSENQMPTSNAAGTDFDYTGVGTIDSIDTDRIEVDTIEVSEDILFTTDATVNIGSNVSAAGTGFFKRLVLDQNQTFETGTGVWFGNGNTGFYEAANNDFRFKVGNAIVALWSSAEVQLKWVLPVVDNSYCLGTTTRNWRNLYLQGSIYNANDECIDIDSAASTFHHDIHFSDDATYDVGSSTNEVDSIYVVSVKASGNIESDTITANTGIFNTDVGIGVTDPIESLDINGGIISRGALVLGGVPGTYISYESGVSSLFAYGSDGSTKGSFAFLTRESDGGNSSTPLVIDGNDRIGINQSSPSEKLDLVGNFEITGDTYMGLNNTYDIGNDTASVDSVYVNIIEANTVNANIITATGGTSTNWNTGYSNSTGVVTVHSDVTNAGSGIITTGTERTNWNAGYNDKIKSLGFATGTGVLTLTQQDDGTLTQDLDGRYLELGGGTMTGNIAQSSDISLGTATYDITLDCDSLKGTPVWDGNLKVDGIITATGGTSTEWNTAYDNNHAAVTLNASATTGGLGLSTQELTFRAATNEQTGYATNTHITAIETNTTNNTGVVTIHSDVSNAGSGIITTGDERTNWNAGYNDKINSMGFATGTGVLTLTQQDAGTVTQDLDGRYLELGGGTMTGNIAQSADISLGTANYDLTINSDSTDVNYLSVENIAIDYLTTDLIPDTDSAYDIGLYESLYIDGSNDHSVGETLNSANDTIGQTFLIGPEDIILESIDLYIQNFSGLTGNIIIKIQSLTSGLPNGNSLATVSILASSIGARAYYNIQFSTEPILSANTSYAITVNAPNAVAGDILLWCGKNAGTYPNGHRVMAIDGTAWTGGGSVDYAFKIYQKLKGFKNLYLAGDAEIAGDLTADMLKQEETWDAFGGFEDSTSVITITEDAYSQITNSGNDLWQGVHSNGITISNDTITFANAGTYTGSISITFIGDAQDDYRFRIYNVTDAAEEGFAIGQTGNGAADWVSITKPLFFLNVSAGDEFVFEVTNLDATHNMTAKYGSFYIQYLHN